MSRTTARGGWHRHSKGATGTSAPSDMARAVRQELTAPGSVTPQRQLELVLADRGVEPAATGRGAGWSPFSGSVDASPYRPLAAASWLTSTGPAPGVPIAGLMQTQPLARSDLGR